VRAALDLYAEHSLQPSRPTHRHMPWRRRLGVARSPLQARCAKTGRSCPSASCHIDATL
jgi:hypothetical protein